MKRMGVLLLLAATSASAASEPDNQIQVERDTRRGVTCYILNGVGISCLPDTQLKAEHRTGQAGSGGEQPMPADAPALCPSLDHYQL